MLVACVGKAKAVTATARKIAVRFDNTLRYGTARTTAKSGIANARSRTCDAALTRWEFRGSRAFLRELPRKAAAFFAKENA
jgi:hypothetical protein